MNAPSISPVYCATDFSEAAQQAADVASLLAQKMQAPLVLVHGIDERGEIPPHHWPSLFATDQPRLLEEAQRLQAKGGTVEPVLAGALPDDGVVRRAEKARARLIVVSSSGLGVTYRWLMGSVSERIAETATVPTLVVRNAPVLEAWLLHQRPLRVFIGVDFTATSDIALRWLAELATIAPCEVTVGYVDREAEDRGREARRLPPGAPPAPEMHQMLEHDLRQKAAPLFGEQNVQVYVLAAEDRVDSRLLELAEETQADLIVIGTHQWHGLERLWHHSVSRRILHAAKANVVCVPTHVFAHANRSAPLTVHRVLAAVSLSPHGGRAIAPALSVLHAGDVVRLLNVSARDVTADSRLNLLGELIPAEAKKRGIRTELEVVEDDDIAGAICQAAERFGADLISVGASQRSGLRSAESSLVRALIGQSRRPLLVASSPDP